MALSFPSIDEFDNYVKQLGYHDWTYDYSDDGSVYRRGQAQRDALVAQARTHSVYQNAFNAYRDYVFPKKEDYSSEGWKQRGIVKDQQIQQLRDLVAHEARNRVVTIQG